MTESPAILVIDDEPHARALLHGALERQGYRCLEAATGEDGISAALETSPNTVLLDLGLPDMDGVEVARRIRERSSVPIIVVSARVDEADKIDALDGGATDYVVKPFGEGELLARIRAALRNGGADAESLDSGSITIGDLTMDFDLRKVTASGREVRLTPTEYRLLRLLVRSAGRVLTHRQILKAVWGPNFTTEVQYLRVYMKKLRYKLEAEPARPKYLINEAGVGYRLRVPS
ncbi:MAG TPA: response regulator transcription factor [Polyangiaceae bacterium]|jgi:two-component system KDP operon response regulator KdpE|nr:response regulator transcription factor [Polyangiaceae bacterium]